MFVNFDREQELTVKRYDLSHSTATVSDWNGIFSEFVDQITNFTGEEITEILKPNFTTTTPISLAVGQISIMSAMKISAL